MATSGTTTFESGLSISDIVEESYERLGILGVSGHQLKSARRSLNILFQEWANRGLHYWEVANNSYYISCMVKQLIQCLDQQQMGLLSATAVYGVDDILEASYRNANVDTPLTKVSRSQYQAFSNKTSDWNTVAVLCSKIYRQDYSYFISDSWFNMKQVSF
jgi:hypothetical protein